MTISAIGMRDGAEDLPQAGHARGERRTAGAASPQSGRPRRRPAGRGPTRLIWPREHVEQLGELVERGGAQEASDPSHSRVTVDLEQAALNLVEPAQVSLIASASCTIERNLTIRKRSPRRPIRG